MTQPFDPAATRRAFERSLLDYIQKESQSTFEFPGHLASGLMSSVIAGWWVGYADRLEAPMRSLVDKFERANAADERFGDLPHFYAAVRNDAYGLCLWMLNGASEERPFRFAVDHWEQHFGHEGKRRRRGPPRFDAVAQRFEDPWIPGIPFESKDILHGSLADYLASCLQCREFARGAALYERVGGRTDLSESRIQTDIHLGYWLCKQGASGQVPAETCMKIGARVLGANLQTQWLGRGQHQRAATWLKIVAEFAQWNLAPGQVLLRAYEFMPDVARPAADA